MASRSEKFGAMYLGIAVSMGEHAGECVERREPLFVALYVGVAIFSATMGARVLATRELDE